MKIIKDSNKWWFIYEIVIAVFTLSVLIFGYVEHLITKTWMRSIDEPFSYTGFQGQYFSYFTIQSNIIVFVWFLLAAIYHFKSDKPLILRQGGLIVISLYISITFITYMTMMLPFAATTMTPITWFENMSQHLIVPLLVICYMCFHIGEKPIVIKEYLKKKLWINFLYPLFYFLYIILRLYMGVLDDKPTLLYFPYLPKLDVANWLLVVLVIIASIIILILFVVVNIFYCYINNKIYERKEK